MSGFQMYLSPLSVIPKDATRWCQRTASWESCHWLRKYGICWRGAKCILLLFVEAMDGLAACEIKAVSQ